MYKFRFFFDFCAGTCFWSDDEKTYEKFGVRTVPPEKLPLSTKTIAKIKKLASEFDTSLNWDSPSDPSP